MESNKEKNEKPEKNNENKTKDSKNKKSKKEQKETNKSENNTKEIKKLQPSIYKFDENSQIDYSIALKNYNLKNINPDNNFLKSQSKLIQILLKRNLIFAERNLEKLNENQNFFILYELLLSENTSLCLSEIIILNIIKNIMQSNQKIHLIIQIADDEFLIESTGKFSFKQIKNFSEEKIKNVLSILYDSENMKNNIHIFSNYSFRTFCKNYESLVSDFKMQIIYKKVVELFNITEDDSVSKLDYPCYIAMASNPNIYKQFISDINENSTCLIINSIFFMNRYMLCYDASKINNFNEPVLIALKIVNNLTGCNGYDCYFENNKELKLLLEDNEKILRKKIMKHSLSGARGNGTLEDHKKFGGNVDVDISCQYLKFLEEDDDKLNEMIEKFVKGELSCGEIKQILFEKLNEMFNKIRNNKEKNVNKELIESFRLEKEKN